MPGWGVFNENNGDCYQGEWLDEDKENHINYLELKVGFIALTKFCGDIGNGHVRLYMDNSVASNLLYFKNGGKDCVAQRPDSFYLEILHGQKSLVICKSYCGC